MANGNGGNGHGDDNGSKGDRATVALVAASVNEVKAIVQGHADTTKATLEGIRDSIKPLASMPERVTRVESTATALEVRVTDLEDANQRRREWGRATAVTAGLATIGLLINLAIALHWFGIGG